MTCPQCGTRYDDWDPTKGGHFNAFHARNRVCVGCKVRHDAYTVASDSTKGNTQGLQIDLVRNPDAPPIPPIMR